MHRTEVCRAPAQADEPIFPLKYKYMRCNYTVEGLENKDQEGENTAIPDFEPLEPIMDPEQLKAAIAEPYSHEVQLTKVSASGAILNTDEYGTALRRSKHWKPKEVPDNMWKSMPQMRDTCRSMFPDPRKMPVDTKLELPEGGLVDREDKKSDKVRGDKDVGVAGGAKRERRTASTRCSCLSAAAISTATSAPFSEIC